MMNKMMKFVIFSQILVFIFCERNLQNKLFDRRAVKLTRVDGHCQGRNNILVVNYLKVVKCDTRSAFVENSTIVVKEDLTDNLKVSIIANRCRSRENLDSCEEIYNIKNLNGCQLINPNSAILTHSPLAVPYKPKFECPIKKGVYQANNFTLNLLPLVFFNLDGWYWKIVIEVFSADLSRLITCAHIEGYSLLKTTD